MIVEFPCITYLFSYTDRKTDRLADGKTDRQADREVNKTSIFFLFFVGGGRGCGYWVDGRKIHLGRQRGM